MHSQQNSPSSSLHILSLGQQDSLIHVSLDLQHETDWPRKKGPPPPVKHGVPQSPSASQHWSGRHVDLHLPATQPSHGSVQSESVLHSQQNSPSSSLHILSLGQQDSLIHVSLDLQHENKDWPRKKGPPPPVKHGVPVGMQRSATQPSHGSVQSASVSHFPLDESELPLDEELLLECGR